MPGCKGHAGERGHLCTHSLCHVLLLDHSACNSCIVTGFVFLRCAIPRPAPMSMSAQHVTGLVSRVVGATAAAVFSLQAPVEAAPLHPEPPQPVLQVTARSAPHALWTSRTAPSLYSVFLFPPSGPVHMPQNCEHSHPGMCPGARVPEALPTEVCGPRGGGLFEFQTPPPLQTPPKFSNRLSPI